jgi:hypothetical protein
VIAWLNHDRLHRMISRSIKVAAPAKEYLPTPALETAAGVCPNNKPKINELREVALKKIGAWPMIPTRRVENTPSERSSLFLLEKALRRQQCRSWVSTSALGLPKPQTARTRSSSSR